MQKTTLLFLLAFALSVSQQVTTTLVQTTAFETIPPYTGTRPQCAEAWNSGHPVVLYASWGPLGYPVNVTDQVIAIYNNGSRNVQPSTDVFGDPAFGQIKYLSLATVENNRVSTFYARESTGSVPIPSSTDRAYECNQSWNKHHPVIMQARWSSTISSRSLDVTEKVIQMFQSGTRQFRATNDMWTDIAPQEVKQLSIFYFYKGVANASTAREGGVVSLPVPVALCAEAWNSGHPAILYASWGPLNYPIDVTDKVIAIYNNGGRSVQPSTKVFGDPAPGQIKYLSLATVVNIHHSDVAYIEVSNVSTFYAQESTNNVTIPSNPYQSFPSNSMTTAFECNQSWNKHHPVIIQALWRSTESNRISDVTEKVIQMFDSGTRQFRATGDMWGQIAYGDVKQLSIFYFYNRLANSATAREGGVATLPVA